MPRSTGEKKKKKKSKKLKLDMAVVLEREGFAIASDFTEPLC